jgi:hypothetical protein
MQGHKILSQLLGLFPGFTEDDSAALMTKVHADHILPITAAFSQVALDRQMLIVIAVFLSLYQSGSPVPMWIS